MEQHRSRGWLYLVVALVVLLVLSIFGIATISTIGISCESSSKVTSAQVSVTTEGITVRGEPLDEEQTNIAEQIIGIGQKRGFSTSDIEIAIMVAYQESGIRNLRYGDRDSLGVYQQRPSVKVWGTAEEILNVPHAINAFYDALEQIDDRENKSYLDIALAVQRPSEAAYKDNPANRFMDWLPLAKALVNGVIKGTETVKDVASDVVCKTQDLIAQATGTNIPLGPPGDCPAGADAGTGQGPHGETLQLCNVNGIIMEAGVSANFQAMLRAAAAEGIELSGSGYRSHASQIALRKQNCGTSSYAIYQMPSSACSPSTAIPGESRHELGRAADLRWNGAAITSHSSPAWQVLNRIAKRFGFGNLPSEPWHWDDVH